jgi:uncharacterized protein (TIGR02646 family)
VIPVLEQPEPLDFEDKVAKKGRRFLTRNPNPHNWKGKSYWTDALQDLWHAYNGVCAYCCHWIPPEQGAATVDHFAPKSLFPHKAYEWRNYRLAASNMNAKKGQFTDVMDPFLLTPDTFLLVFPGMLVKPNPILPAHEKKQAEQTVRRLALNDNEILVRQRLNWVLAYCDGKFNFEFLKEKAPFIAYEVERQGILEQLPLIFRRRARTT